MFAVSGRLSRLIAPVALVALLALPGTASAQSSSLERQRQAVFAQLLGAPTDRALMLQYARLSVQMRDFEAAAATLERFVDLEPGNVGARTELAIAYFALGAYDVARYHLAAAEASGALTPEQAVRVARYRDEAEGRDAPQRISGEIAIGQGRTVDIAEDGPYGSARLEWRIDMGGPNANDWLTQLRYDSFRPGQFSFGARTLAQLRSGPEFRLTGDAYGPRLQPYIEIARLRDESGGGFLDHDAVALGLAYQNPHDARWTSYADVQVGRSEAVDAVFLGDFDFVEVMLGLGFRPSRDTRVRSTLRWRDERYDGFGYYETSFSAEMDMVHSFDFGGDSMAALPRRWDLRGFARRTITSEGDSFGPYGDIIDTSYGLGLRAFVTDAFFVELHGTHLRSDYGFGFAPSETFYGLQIGWEF